LKVTSRDGTAQAGYPFLEATVQGLSYGKDGVRLEINGQKVGMDQLVHVGDPPTSG
jgi:hypothetical protein